MAGQRIEIDGGRTGLVLGVGDDGRLHQLGLGTAVQRQPDPAFPVGLFPLAYPTHGEEALRAPALQVTHADGTTGTRLVVDGIDEATHGEGLVHRVRLVDRVQPLRVELCWRTWPAFDLIEQWVEVTAFGEGPSTLHRFASAAPAVGNADPHLTHWGGGWANEWVQTTEPVAPGVKTVASFGGVRSSLHRSPIALWTPDGRGEEEAGDALAMTVVHGGDVRFDAEMAMLRQCRLLAGAQHEGAARTLDPGVTFATPPVVLAWSDAGIGPTSRSLQRWVRAHVVRDGHRPRAIVFNNWEAMGFGLTTASVNEVIDGAAALGAELFLLDDGWFGLQHPRDDDTQGLGDWVVDAAKFPDGLGPVVDHALGAGLRFGLWVEPEMVNPRSATYEAHPEWVIAEPGRERREERQQLVLDVCQPEVEAFVVDVVDRCLALHPGISYLKWDANRDVFEAGTPALPADRQQHLAVDRVRATLRIMDEVARRHPDVELMLCASGGGRSDLAHLARFHELWASDDTDPVDRVRIQWGASHLLPANVIGAHVTRWGQRPVAFACAVALSARFGFDLDPRTATADERAVLADAAVVARELRSVVQQGDTHRLVSPLDGPRAALASVHGDEVAVFAYVLDAGGEGDPPPIAVPALDPDASYLVTDLTPGAPSRGSQRVVAGADLAAGGALAWPDAPAPAAAVWRVSVER